jgi:Fic family protein
VSVSIARDPGGYLAGLTRFRLGELDSWVDWLAAELRHSSQAAQGLLERSEQLLVEWARRVGDLRGDATARRVLPLLLAHPVVSSDLVAVLVDVSERAARAALTVLANRGILEPFDRAPVAPGRPRRLWMAPDIIALVTNWSSL